MGRREWVIIQDGFPFALLDEHRKIFRQTFNSELYFRQSKDELVAAKFKTFSANDIAREREKLKRWPGQVRFNCEGNMRCWPLCRRIIVARCAMRRVTANCGSCGTR